jgi:hypothetical protein
LGFYFIQQLARGFLDESLTNGSSVWDTRFQYILAIVLQTSPDVRVGDIIAPDNDKELHTAKPAVYCSDVKLVPDGGDGLEHVKGRWTIRNAKSIQGDQKKAYAPDEHAFQAGIDNYNVRSSSS